ncbi:MAG: hypothetical protein M3Y27_24470, partial [Acidobacteriota bacterium]|nr:hypothetical protein [Acidobacteriota bacterium]
DPRVAAGAAGSGLDTAHAFDIRIDAPPLAFFEGTVDGVECDEDLGAGPLLPGQTNFVCVQVLNSGFQAAQNVAVHLYFQQVANAAAANGLGNLGDFWRKPQNFDPVGGSPWQRVGPPVLLADVGPAKPGVARFEWVPPTVLAGNSVALVAICSGAPPDDLPAAIPGGAATVAALITNELRSALRVAGVGPFAAPRPNIFIRHGGNDEGAPGDVRFGGRSPDIIVVQAAPANPKAAFQDLIAPRSDDFISPTGSNFIYVRVHNRGDFPVPVDVQLFWAKPNVAADAAEAQAPPFDNTKWSGVAPLTSANNVVIPPHDWDLAKLQWDSPQTTVRADNPHASILLMALIKSSDNQDPIPVRTRVSGLAEFFDFFRILPDSENAAMRAIGYHAAL